MKYFDCLALTIAIIGAVNWGLIGLFGFNLVAALFGSMSLLFLYESEFIRGEFCKILGRSFFGYSARWDIISAEGIIVG